MMKLKSCPKCNRTYSDLTLSFCLEDGFLLSAPFEISDNVEIKDITLLKISQNASFKPEFSPEIETFVRPVSPSDGSYTRFIQSTVSRYHSLSIKTTKDGLHHRIMKSGWNGSIWTVETNKGYRVETTGNVAILLNNKIMSLYGQNDGENNKGYKFWFMNNLNDVEKIIDIYGKI